MEGQGAKAGRTMMPGQKPSGRGHGKEWPGRTDGDPGKLGCLDTWVLGKFGRLDGWMTTWTVQTGRYRHARRHMCTHGYSWDTCSSHSTHVYLGTSLPGRHLSVTHRTVYELGSCGSRVKVVVLFEEISVVSSHFHGP